jgi:hypothetical protein
MYFLSLSSFHLPSLPYVQWSSHWSLRGPKRAISFTLSLLHVLSPLWPGCGVPPLSYWLPCPCPILTFSPTDRSRFCLDWLVPISQTDSSCAAYSSPWWWKQQVPLNCR